MDPIETYPLKITAEYIGLASNTLRTWTKESYLGPYLSEYANPEPGKERRFTEEDIRLLITAVILRGQGLKFASIIPRIAEGERIELPEGEPLRDTYPKGESPRAEDRALAPADLMERFEIFLRPYESQIEQLRQDLEARDKKLEEIEEARREAERELSRLKGRLEEKDRPWYKRLFGG